MEQLCVGISTYTYIILCILYIRTCTPQKHTYVHTGAHMYTHTYAHTYTHVHTHTHTHMHMHTHHLCTYSAHITLAIEVY